MFAVMELNYAMSGSVGEVLSAGRRLPVPQGAAASSAGRVSEAASLVRRPHYFCPGAARLCGGDGLGLLRA